MAKVIADELTGRVFARNLETGDIIWLAGERFTVVSRLQRNLTTVKTTLVELTLKDARGDLRFPPLRDINALVDRVVGSRSGGQIN